MYIVCFSTNFNAQLKKCSHSFKEFNKLELNMLPLYRWSDETHSSWGESWPVCWFRVCLSDPTTPAQRSRALQALCTSSWWVPEGIQHMYKQVMSLLFGFTYLTETKGTNLNLKDKDYRFNGDLNLNLNLQLDGKQRNLIKCRLTLFYLI